jgi:hypothetical protein
MAMNLSQPPEPRDVEEDFVAIGVGRREQKESVEHLGA